MATKWKKFMTLQRRKDYVGYIFVLPLIIGLIAFFILPMIKSLIYAFSNVAYSTEGLQVTFSGLENYKRIFVTNVTVPIIVESISSSLLDLPLILIFSLFVAMLINSKFKGRAFARAVYFLPVIVTSGVLLLYSTETAELFSKTVGGMEDSETAATMSHSIKIFLMQLQLNATLVTYITGAIDRIYDVINYSGLQILIFLTALQNVSGELKEASYIDGATSWEIFWKITLPIISPFIQVNIVYTIVDAFTRSTNPVITEIDKWMNSYVNVGGASILAWAYFLVILIALGIILFIVNKFVYYDN